MKDRRATVQSFGCRLNIWESEVISRHGEEAGLANTIIINTCAVTAEAEKQARQAVRRQRRDHPDSRIVVTGCAAQIDPASWQAMAEVDAVIGNHEKLQPDTWQKLAARNTPDTMMAVGDIMTVRDVAPHLLEGFDHHTRAFLQVQQGCDHRCTFCIIPYGRGNSRSVTAADIISQTRQLAEAGIAEVVLTGVDITSWGGDLNGTPKLGGLVRQLLDQVPQLQRLRLSSVDPAEADDDLLTALADDHRLMPHLHLSVQHGHDLILKRMKRRHSATDVLDLVREVRRIRPDTVFGADLIAGFPTEDDAAHEATLNLIDDAQLTWLHVFPYSPRQGTPAARMPQVDGTLIRQRAASLRERAARHQQAFLDSRIGHDDEVLMETGGIGHSRQFARVRIEGPHSQAPAGTVCPVRITAREGDVLIAEKRA
jgi:threonylcarbamoyladenosine tRNA methylthiotransferase MtaB